MPYSSTSRLPASVRNSLPKGAQTIYRKAFENAWEEYKDSDKRRGRSSREESAHKVAWSAVKTRYKKNDEGKWSARGADGSGGSARLSRKPGGNKAKAGTRSAAAKKKPARKSSGAAAKKADGDKRQARWKTASAGKSGQKTRGRAASSRGGAGRQPKTAARKSAESSQTGRRQTRRPRAQAAVTASAGQQPQAEQLMSQQQTERTSAPQGDAGQVS